MSDSESSLPHLAEEVVKYVTRHHGDINPLICTLTYEQGTGGPLTQVAGYAVRVRGPVVNGQYVRDSQIQWFLPISTEGRPRNRKQLLDNVPLFLMEINRDRIVSIVYEAKL